jgi:NADH-quinone oxidoreductase subunit G
VPSPTKVAGSKKIGAIAGDLAAVEEMFALKATDRTAWVRQSRRPRRGEVRPATGRASYMFNPTIAGIEQADALLIVGANPRKEAPFSTRASASAGAPVH